MVAEKEGVICQVPQNPAAWEGLVSGEGLGLRAKLEPVRRLQFVGGGLEESIINVSNAYFARLITAVSRALDRRHVPPGVPNWTARAKARRKRDLPNMGILNVWACVSAALRRAFAFEQDRVCHRNQKGPRAVCGGRTGKRGWERWEMAARDIPMIPFSPTRGGGCAQEGPGRCDNGIPVRGSSPAPSAARRRENGNSVLRMQLESLAQRLTG